MSSYFSKKITVKSPKPFRVFKSSYILALIKHENLLSWGAVSYDDLPIYYILKEYDGTAHHETCALLAIGKPFWPHLVEEYSDLLQTLRNAPFLCHIEGIRELTFKHIIDPILKFKDCLEKGRDEEYLIFNVEPKGSGKYESHYPVPRLSVPGGSMEADDNNNFELCAFREFMEETGFDIRSNCAIVKSEKIKRPRKLKKINGDFKNFRYKHKHKEKYTYISIFFFVELYPDFLPVTSISQETSYTSEDESEFTESLEQDFSSETGSLLQGLSLDNNVNESTNATSGLSCYRNIDELEEEKEEWKEVRRKR